MILVEVVVAVFLLPQVGLALPRHHVFHPLEGGEILAVDVIGVVLYMSS